MAEVNHQARVIALLLLGLLSGCCAGARAARDGRSAQPVQIRAWVMRLVPGDDLKQALVLFAKEKRISSGFIMSAVGSVDGARIRLADQHEPTSFPGRHEIVSLSGTLEADGAHLHLAISDGSGETIGGHLVEGCKVYTTAEIVIGEAQGLTFSRELDPVTGYRELTIRQEPPASQKR